MTYVITPTIYMDDKGRSRNILHSDVETIKRLVNESFGMNIINCMIYPRHGDDWKMSFLLFRKGGSPLAWHSFWISYETGKFVCDNYKFGIEPTEMWKIHSGNEECHGYLADLEKNLNSRFTYINREIFETYGILHPVNFYDEYCLEEVVA